MPRARDHPALALDGFEDDRGEVVADRGHRRAQGGLVVERDVNDPAHERLERLAVGGLPGERERPRGAAVEGSFGGDDGASPGAAGELDRRLDGLGPGVGEEDRRPWGCVGDAQQRLGELDLGRVVKKFETWTSCGWSERSPRRRGPDGRGRAC